LLEDHDARTFAAGSAQAAFKLLGEVRPDVLVSDIGMPDEDGYTLLRRIRALPSAAGGAVPAIALTAFVRAADRAWALAAGYQAHLGKPVRVSQLLASVSALAHRRAGDLQDSSKRG
jgi:CheY-like chemotaxis protein